MGAIDRPDSGGDNPVGDYGEVPGKSTVAPHSRPSNGDSPGIDIGRSQKRSDCRDRSGDTAQQPNEQAEQLADSVHDLAGTLDTDVAAWTLANASEAARKAIVVCDALERSLTAPPAAKLVKRGELSAEVLIGLPWDSIASTLGLESDHPSVSNLADRIRRFAKIAVDSEEGTDLARNLQIVVGGYDDALAGIEQIRVRLANSLSSNAEKSESRDSDIIAAQFSDRPAAVEDWSMCESILRIGCGVLVATTLGAPIGAAVFHDPLIPAALKAGVVTLIGQVAGETVNYQIKARKSRSPNANFDRCHQLLVRSAKSCASLAQAATKQELDIARAHVLIDARAASLCTFRFSNRGAVTYRDCITEMLGTLTVREQSLQLESWASRLESLAPAVKEKSASTPLRSGLSYGDQTQDTRIPAVADFLSINRLRRESQPDLDEAYDAMQQHIMMQQYMDRARGDDGPARTR